MQMNRVIPLFLLLLGLAVAPGVLACPDEPSVLESGSLRVVTLNVAHGRGA